MPLYRVMTDKGLLDDDSRLAFSQDVTDIHCDITGAPPEFVHVLYRDAGPDELDTGSSAFVFGSIRSGRTHNQKTELATRLTDALASRADVDSQTVSVLTVDIPADWTMEGGRLLPEPGAEDDWLAAGQAET